MPAASSLASSTSLASVTHHWPGSPRHRSFMVKGARSSTHTRPPLAWAMDQLMGVAAEGAPAQEGGGVVNIRALA